MTKEIFSALWQAFLMGLPLLVIVPLIGLAMRDHVKAAALRAATRAPKDREDAFLIECAGIYSHAGKIWAAAGVLYGLLLVTFYEPMVGHWWIRHIVLFFRGHA